MNYMDGLTGSAGLAGTGMMLGGPVGAGIGAGAGLLNYFAFQKPAENRARQLAATTQRYSPWTKMQAQAPEATNPMSSALGLASAGAQFGQNMDQAKQQNALQNAWMSYLSKGTPGGMDSQMASMPSSENFSMPQFGGSSRPADPTYGGWLSGGR